MRIAEEVLKCVVFVALRPLDGREPMFMGSAFWIVALDLAQPARSAAPRQVYTATRGEGTWTHEN
jgi:hypothetical protein